MKTSDDYHSQCITFSIKRKIQTRKYPSKALDFIQLTFSIAFEAHSNYSPLKKTVGVKVTRAVFSSTLVCVHYRVRTRTFFILVQKPKGLHGKHGLFRG